MTSRGYLIAAAVAIAMLAGAFTIGRFTAPLKVETREVEKVVEKEVIKEVEKIVTVEKAAKVETRIVWRDRIVEVSGRVTEHEVEKTGALTVADKTDIVDKSATLTRDVERIVEREKIVTVRPSWRVGILVGASYQAPLLPIAGPLVMGAEGSFRIAGGLWVGVWTLPQHGAVGGSVSLDF